MSNWKNEKHGHLANSILQVAMFLKIQNYFYFFLFLIFNTDNSFFKICQIDIN